jgi:hypothetical protein
MGYRVVVDKPRQIRALTSSAKVSVANANLQKSQALVSKPSYTVTTTAQFLNVFSSYVKPTTEIHYQKLGAIDVKLDAYSLNQYFRLESFGIFDSQALNIDKASADSIGVTDQLSDFVLGKELGDEFGFVDIADVLLQINRSFSESIEFTDTQSFEFEPTKIDSLGGYDVASRVVEKGLTDTPTLFESTAVDFNTGAQDTTSINEQLSRQVSYARNFNDQPLISEQTATAVNKPLIDIPTVTDLLDRVVSYQRGFSNSIGTSDHDSRTVSKNTSDVLSVTEVFSRVASFSRSFSDAFSLDDFTDVNAISKDTLAGKANIFGFTDDHSFGLQKNIQDTANVSDLPSLSLIRPASDDFSVGDVFQKVTNFSRAFNESAAVAESSAARVDKNLSDTTSVSEEFQKDVVFDRTFSDAVSFAEQTVAAFGIGLTDTASLTETISISTTSLASSVLNASALNSASLN